MKDNNTYFYMLRFNKELERDRQALDKITQFCKVTGMTMRDAILLILSTVDTSALHKSILSLTVTAEQTQDTEKNKKRNEPVYEKQQEEKEEENNSGQTEDEGLFSNPRFKEIFSNFQAVKFYCPP